MRERIPKVLVQVQEGRGLTSRRHQDPWWGACHWGQGLCWKVINTNVHFFGQICCLSSSSATAIQVENSLGGELVLDNVPIVTPNCDVVVPSLSLTVTWTIGYYDYDVVMIICPSHWQQVLWWLYWCHGCSEYTKNPILNPPLTMMPSNKHIPHLTVTRSPPSMMPSLPLTVKMMTTTTAGVARPACPDLRSQRLWQVLTVQVPIII